MSNGKRVKITAYADDGFARTAEDINRMINEFEKFEKETRLCLNKDWFLPLE